MFLIYFILVAYALFMNPHTLMSVNALDYVACGSATGIPKPIPQITTIVYTLLMVGGPITLVIFAIATLIKSMSRNDQEEILKAKNKLLKKFLLAGVLFLTASIVQFVLSRVTSTAEDKSTLATCLKCFLTYNNNDCVVSSTGFKTESGTYTSDYYDVSTYDGGKTECGGVYYPNKIKETAVEAADDADFDFWWPLPKPYVTSGSSYGCRINPGNQLRGQCLLHAGLDLSSGGNSCVPIYAAADGYVSITVSSNYGCGNYVAITHSGGYMTKYCHQTKYVVEKLEAQERLAGLDSKAGAVLAAWIKKTGQENPLYLYFDKLQSFYLILP